MRNLYDRHAGRLLVLTTRILGDGSQAEDLVHDVSVEAWHRALEFDPKVRHRAGVADPRTRSRALDRLGHRQRGARVLSQIDGAATASRVLGRDGDGEGAGVYQSQIFQHLREGGFEGARDLDQGKVMRKRGSAAQRLDHGPPEVANEVVVIVLEALHGGCGC